MIIIDPDGLFHGKRLARCSDQAQLYFPRLLLASNGYGRLEIDFHRIRSEAFSGFHDKPSDEDIAGAVEEYAKNFLLFIYVADGQTWGQWDVAPNLLPRYKNAIDRRSPAPDANQVKKWIEAAKAQKAHTLPRISENFPKNFRPAVAVAGAVAVAVVGADSNLEVVGPVQNVQNPEKNRSAIIEHEQERLLQLRKQRNLQKEPQAVGELFAFVDLLVKNEVYQCECGNRFPAHLGKHGCPNCNGEGKATLVKAAG